MEREANVAHSFAAAERWSLEQMWAMTPEQRYEIARILREGAYGRDAPDVREAERSCRPKDLDDLQRLPRA